MTSTEDRIRQAVRIRLSAYIGSRKDLTYAGVAKELGTGKGDLFRLLNPGAPKPRGGFYDRAGLALHVRAIDLLELEIADLVPPVGTERPSQWHDIEAEIQRLHMPEKDRRFLAAVTYAAFNQLREQEVAGEEGAATREGAGCPQVGSPKSPDTPPLTPVAPVDPAKQIQEPLPKILPPEDNGLGIGGEWTWLISLCAGPNADSSTRSAVAGFLSRDWELIQAEVDKTLPANAQARNAGIKALSIRYWRQEARSGPSGQSDTARAVSDALDGLGDV